MCNKAVTCLLLFVLLMGCAVPITAQRVLDTVVVQANKAVSFTGVQDVLTQKSIQLRSGESLGEILQQLNGVQVLQTGTTIFKPVMQGMHSNRVLIMNNGVRLEGQQWGSEHAPEIDPMVAQKITAVKGAAAIRYGADAIGGVLLVEAATPSQNQPLKISVNTGYFSNNRQWNANVYLSKGSKNASYWVQSSFKRGGNAQTPQYWLGNTGLKEWNASTGWEYKKNNYTSSLYGSIFTTSIGIFDGSHISNTTDLLAVIANGKPLLNYDFTYQINRPNQEIQHYLLRWKQTWRTASNATWQLTTGYQENRRREFDASAIAPGQPELALNIGTATIDGAYNFTRQNIKTTLGAFGMRQQNVWSGRRFFIPNFEQYNAALYAIRQHSFRTSFLEYSVRYDYRWMQIFRNRNNVISSENRQFHNVSGAIGFTQKLSTRWNLTTQYTLAWRPPGINELFVNGLHHGSATVEIGDSSLRSETAHKFHVQANYTNADSTLQIEAQFYTNFIQNFINLEPVLPPTLTIRGAFPTFAYKQANAWFTGLDASVTKQFSTHWQVKGLASLLYAYNTTTQNWLMQMPANRFQLITQYNVKNKANTGFGLRILHVAHQSRFVPGQDYLPPPPAYTLMGLDVVTSQKLAHTQLQWSLTINNVFNTVYRDYMNRFRYYADEMGRNIQVRCKIDL